MISTGDVIVVAFSGGPDSMCVLDILDQVKTKYAIRLCLAHLNHGIRGEAAEQDVRFAEEVAARRNLMFLSSRADVPAYAKENRLSVEAAGRKLRYEFLLRTCLMVGAAKVALGHTADDQAETILMRLLRGAGPGGLAGIPPTRLLNEQNDAQIIRPLINIWRSEIVEYLRSRNLAYRSDATNETPEYFRNKVRLELIPRLEKEYNPQIKQRLAVSASALAVENDFLSEEASLLAEEVLLERKPGWVLFDARMLSTLHPALRMRILARLMKCADVKSPMLEALHLAGMDATLDAGGKLDLPGGFRLEVSEALGLISDLRLRPVSQKKAFSIPLPGTHAIPAFNLLVRTTVLEKISSPTRLVRLCTPARQYFDLKKVRGLLEIRTRRPGDSFRPLGSRGRKKLKDFFIDRKIPRFLRQHVPLLVSSGRIMWVMGYAIDQYFMLTPDSVSAIRVDYEKSAPGAIPR